MDIFYIINKYYINGYSTFFLSFYFIFLLISIECYSMQHLRLMSLRDCMGISVSICGLWLYIYLNFWRGVGILLILMIQELLSIFYTCFCFFTSTIYIIWDLLA